MESKDYIEICNLMGRYGHIMDECSQIDGQWERLGEVFTADVQFDITSFGGPMLDGLQALIDMWAGSVHPWGHHVTNAVIEADGANGATCDTKLIIVTPDGRATSGIYRDRLVRTPDGWRINHRYCSLRFPDASVPLPLPWR